LSGRVLIWDFDGTLGERPGMWRSALLEVIRREDPSLEVTHDDIRPHLRGGFPWHVPDRPHPELTTPDAWWEALGSLFERAFGAVGFEGERAKSLAKQVRKVYSEPSRWRLFEDTVPTLGLLSERGWKHVILSNHVPELPEILRHLGLDGRIRRVFNSADTGYEKPHPQAFRSVLDTLGDVGEVWMVGDNPEADVRGAERAGIPAILVRNHHPSARRCCEDLTGVPAFLEEESRAG
jgi:putative hydrolase of the HAD superfamily